MLMLFIKRLKVVQEQKSGESRLHMPEFASRLNLRISESFVILPLLMSLTHFFIMSRSLISNTSWNFDQLIPEFLTSSKVNRSLSFIVYLSEDFDSPIAQEIASRVFVG